MDQLSVLATEIDQVKARMETLQQEQSIDSLLEVVEIKDLSDRFKTTPDSLRRKLKLAGGKVFKVGKSYVIRKVALLEVWENLEQNL